jgi:acyl-CoA dehydrogenase
MDGTEEQKRLYFSRVATGERIMSFALTEPDAGSDSAAIKTRGERDGDDYILNGSKRFITNAPRAGAFTLMARTDGPGAGGISSFIVPAGLPGLGLGKPDKKMGQRALHSLVLRLRRRIERNPRHPEVSRRSSTGRASEEASIMRTIRES